MAKKKLVNILEVLLLELRVTVEDRKYQEIKGGVSGQQSLHQVISGYNFEFVFEMHSYLSI
jgi:hypothetical protein